MNSIGDDIGREPRVSEYFANNSRIAVVKRPHSIECVCGMSRPGGHSGTGGIQIGVGMSQADADSPARRLRDHFLRTFQLGGNGHHANVTTRRLPEAVERRQGRQQKVLRWMYTAPDVTEKRTLQMNAQR